MKENEEKRPYKGIFWIKDFLNLVSVKIEVDKNGKAVHDDNLNSKKGDNFNHKMTWERFNRKITDGKPYNYYPRGRVEIRNGKAIIFANPYICTQDVLDMVKNEFHLHAENGIEEIIMKPDYSNHYKCYLDL